MFRLNANQAPKLRALGASLSLQLFCRRLTPAEWIQSQQEFRPVRLAICCGLFILRLSQRPYHPQEYHSLWNGFDSTQILKSNACLRQNHQIRPMQLLSYFSYPFSIWCLSPLQYHHSSTLHKLQSRGSNSRELGRSRQLRSRLWSKYFSRVSWHLRGTPYLQEGMNVMNRTRSSGSDSNFLLLSNDISQ